MHDKLVQIRLDHDSYISLHVQLHNQLRHLIISGRWTHGERIPTETQLSRHLDISRTTVRIALQRIEIEGLIKRAAGRGTFVSHQPHEHPHSRSIGYITHGFHNESDFTILSSAETELRAAGYQVVFSNTMNNADELRALEQMLETDVAGLMIWPNANPTDETASILMEFQRRRKPIVFIDRTIDAVFADYVASDNYGGTYNLVAHLIELGHRNIVQLMPDIDNLRPVENRRRGFISAAADYGLQVHAPWKISSPIRTEFHEQDISQLVGQESQKIIDQILQHMNDVDPKPTAIVCINDVLAIITIHALQTIGYQVPDEISVVGFDDISMAPYISLPLTTVSQNTYELGRSASRLLIERLGGHDPPPRLERIATKLRIRESAVPPTLIRE